MIEDRSDRGGSSTSRPRPSPRSSPSVTASSTSPSPGSSSPRALLDAHGVEPSKALGQHFPIDPNPAAASARVAPDGGRASVVDAWIERGDAVVDVGAGLGALTTAVADRGAGRVLAIE